ncbi:MAG TPA: ATP-binding protein [Pirellulales bacterium]|jgi:two-component system phosphate regulon sensor histidine kinase PhoR|nr:ATP-binding protein [Pirellulales bacterium]
MKKRRLLWQLYPSYLLITLASLVGVGWFASHSLEQFYVAQVSGELTKQARVVDSVLGDDFGPQAAARLRPLCESIARDTQTRISLIDAAGEVFVDTDAALPLANHSDRPEVIEAMTGRTGISKRYSTTVERGMMYVALPAERGGKIVGVVRAAVSLASVDAHMNTLRVQIATGGVAIAALMALVSLAISQRISRPLEEMRIAAERFARGELGYKMLVPDSAEMADLAVTLNEMSRQLEERIRTIVRQRNEQEAVLASMVEGVLAVDVQQRVISVNRAAAQLLESDQAAVLGRGLHEVIRNVDLRRFVSQALVSNEPIESDVVLHGEPPRVLQAHGTSLRDAHGSGVGAVIVLNDITNFRRLENIRRDFVANVSHELKTPITSIKGFVETLLDGAIANPQDAERFLRIIAKQADRLHSIIDDLLCLSKIEQSEGAEDIELETSRVRDVLESAIASCQPQAADRRIDIDLACDPNLTARMNAPLLDQAVVNLLVNAVKYSEPAAKVHVSAALAGGEVVISVKDTGCGIPAEELSRIFERFHRVDKARSRKLGGTGLGLSIVKHIVNVHRGRVTVESTLGKGSTFSIRLPAGSDTASRHGANTLAAAASLAGR